MFITTMNDQIEFLKEEMKKKVKQFDTGFTRFIHPKVSYDKDDDVVDIELSITIYHKYRLPGIELRHHPNHVTDHIKMMLWQFELSAKQKIYDTQIVATMLENGIAKILTRNLRDFSVFKEIEKEDPFISRQN